MNRTYVIKLTGKPKKKELWTQRTRTDARKKKKELKVTLLSRVLKTTKPAKHSRRESMLSFTSAKYKPPFKKGLSLYKKRALASPPPRMTAALDLAASTTSL